MRRRTAILTAALLFGSLMGAHAAGQQREGTDVFKTSSPAVVTISTAAGFGSGVLVDATGVVVTNLHVVQGAAKASVRLPNGDQYDDVAVIDFDIRKDLVLLKVKGFKLPVAELGDSDLLSVGNPVFAIGAPQGLELTMSQGIVSGLRDSGEGYRVVQTTAAISPGSSGGGLFDERGRLIAITSFRIKGGENLNFAIPINYLRGMLATTAMWTLEELSERAELAAPQTPKTAAGATSGTAAAPVMAKLYVSGVSGDQNMALVEQAGPKVSITYSNPSGGVYGSSALVWDSEKKAFIGSGTINTVCGVYDKRIWPAPRQVEIHLFNASIIRHRTLNPVRVNCARSRVIESAWSELVWYVPTK